MVEEDAPEHLTTVTREDAYASTPPFGHFHEGISFFTDGTDNYLMAMLSFGQAFGFGTDMTVCLKIGPDGFVPFTDGPPGSLANFGFYDDPPGAQAEPGWYFAAHARGGVVDPNGNVWLSFAQYGAPGEGTDGMFHYVKNGIGDWFTASLTNEEKGIDDLIWPGPALTYSPSGDVIYQLANVYLDPVLNNSTFGVWACPVIENAKIPLILISGGKAIRVYPDGRMEIINAPQKESNINPTGEVTVVGDT